MDALTKELGFPVGPVTLSDEVGLDIGHHIGKYFIDVFGDRCGFGPLEMEVYSEINARGISGIYFLSLNISFKWFFSVME